MKPVEWDVPGLPWPLAPFVPLWKAPMLHNASLTTLFAVGGEKLIQVGDTYTQINTCTFPTTYKQTKPINDSWFPEDSVFTLTVQVLQENVPVYWSMFDKGLCVTCMLAYVLHSILSAMPELMWARLSQARLQGFWNDCCFCPTLCSESLGAQPAVQHFYMYFPLLKMHHQPRDEEGEKKKKFHKSSIID